MTGLGARSAAGRVLGQPTPCPGGPASRRRVKPWRANGSRGDRSPGARRPGPPEAKSRWLGSRWLGSRWLGSRWLGSRWLGSRWLGRALVVTGLGMIPWLARLAVVLPGTTVADHWAAAWTGLDCLEAAGLVTTGVLMAREDPRGCLTAAVTASLLVMDAWFDVTTSAPGAGQAAALFLALAAELPAAALCTMIALRSLPR